MSTLNAFSIKFFLLLAYFGFAQHVCGQAPQLWGMTYKGGKVSSSESTAGNIFSISGEGNGFKQIHAFSFQNPGNVPNDELTIVNNRFYGTTYAGGNFDAGVIFEYVASSNSYIKLYDFDITDGYAPTGHLIFYNNKLYGIATNFNDEYGGPIIFTFDPLNKVYNVVYRFGPLEGDGPNGLVLYNDLFYGTTRNGGVNYSGVLFRFDPADGTFTKLHDFDQQNGSQPTAALTVYDEKLFGISITGGKNSTGVIFSYDILTNEYIKRFDFDFTTSGIYPSGTMVNFHDHLYGVTSSGSLFGAGALFSYQPDSGNYNSLTYFDSANGISPSGLIEFNNVLYGSTYEGGAYDEGVLYRFDPDINTLNVLYNYQEVMGGGILTPYENKLYGFIRWGGDYKCGMLFNYDLLNNIYNRNIHLNINSGSYPLSSLTEYETGKLYGITNTGSHTGHGGIFEIDPVTYEFSNLHDFDYSNELTPPGGLTEYNHLLYGMMPRGGVSDAGAIFSFDPITRLYKDLYSFELFTKNGIYPQGGLTVYNNQLYGTTSTGGSTGSGVIFRFDPAINKYKRLYSFLGDDGANPVGNLLVYNNQFYGMTSKGGLRDRGVLFMYDSATNVSTKLFDFTRETGYNPYGSLIAFNDQLYGLTSEGGANKYGVLFRFDPISKAYTVLFDFDGINGSGPLGSLMIGSDMKLYGMTQYGGKHNYGVIFQFDPFTNTLHKIKDLDILKTGASPKYSQLIELSHTCLTPSGLHSSQIDTSSELLQWDSIPGILGYQINVYDDSFHLILSKKIHRASNYTLDNLQPSHIYSWQVATICPNALVSMLSDTAIFTISAQNRNAGYSYLRNTMEQEKTPVYPNPAINWLYVDLSWRKDGEVTVKLSNTSGQVVLQEKLNAGVHRINISSLPRGFYILTVISSKDVQTEKLILE